METDLLIALRNLSMNKSVWIKTFSLFNRQKYIENDYLRKISK